MHRCSSRRLQALTISSLELVQLPLLKFPNRVVMVNSWEEDRSVQSFFKEPPGNIVGLDSEAKPSFGLPPHRKNRTAIIQLATHNVACIWRVSGLSELPPTLSSILESEHILKVAQGAALERQTLHNEFNIVCQKFVDLHELAMSYKCQPRSLQALVGIFLERRLRKEERCSNWDQNPLSQEQVDYAATDAYASLMVLLAMRKKLNPNGREEGPLPLERILSGPISHQAKESLISWTEATPKSTVVIGEEDGPLQRLTKICISRGFMLKSEGFESAPGGFRAVFRVTTSTRHHIFRSLEIHASIREAQNDSARCALEALETI